MPAETPNEPDAPDSNIAVMCMNCQTRYTTSAGGFLSRNCACPRCGAWKAMSLERVEEEGSEG
jgi:hypothetical protein